MEKIKKILSNKALIIFLLFFPHAYHIGFPNNNFWFVDYIMVRWNIISLLVLIFIFIFVRKKRPSLLLLILAIAEVWIIVTTYLYNPNRLYKAILYVSSSLSISLLIEIYIDDFKELISSLMLAFEIQLYPNLITVFLYNKTSHLVAGYHENNFLLGTKNDLILYLLPALCLSILYIIKIKKSPRPFALIAVIALTVIFSYSTTTLLAFVFAGIVFIYCYFIRKNKVRNVYFIVAIPIVLMLIVILPYMFNGANPLVDYIMNNIYYKHSFICRTEIWTQASTHIPNKLLTGYGYINQSLIYIDDLGRTYAGNAHCDFIQRFLNYGLIGVSLFTVFNIVMINKLNKTKSNTIKSLFIALISGIYLTFIAQAYHRFFEFQVIFFLAYYASNIISNRQEIELNPLTINDIKDFYKIKCEKSNIYWTGWNNKPKYEDIKEFINNNKDNRKIYLAKVDLSTVGYVYLDFVDKETFHISPAISNRFQSMGYGEEMIKQTINIGKNLGFSKAEAYIREDNIASKKCFEKCGFIETKNFENKYIPNQNRELKMIKYSYELV